MNVKQRPAPRGRRAVAAVAFVALAAASFAGGCAGCHKEQQAGAPGRLFVTWEFKSADREAEPYTEAALVINGNRYHRHVIGVFYGKVRKILKPEEITRELIGGTISGFVTVGDRQGHEVIVRYNERLARLIVAEREWSERLPPGAFRVIKNIPVPELRNEDTGF
ncbi:MAG: hypothetical protein JW807_03630 [Spirochaetes bacterium]|nr:hypothetical protein [Spirochaetota bacterium]